MNSTEHSPGVRSPLALQGHRVQSRRGQRQRSGWTQAPREAHQPGLGVKRVREGRAGEGKVYLTLLKLSLSDECLNLCPLVLPRTSISTAVSPNLQECIWDTAW